MTIPANQVQEANDAAARAASAWLLSVGLAVEIDGVRFPDGFSPVPAPGLATFVADAQRASVDAALAADRTAALATDADASSAATKAAAEALAAADAAELAARQMAQLAFGVSAHLTGNDRAHRLDRAAVAVLFPPPFREPRARLADEDVVLRARVRPELVMEIAGVICRLLVQRNACLCMTGPGNGVVEVSVDEGTTLQVLSKVKPGDLDGDWQAAMGGGWLARWRSPVTVREPAEVVADLLLPHRTMSEGDVLVDVSPIVVEPADRLLGPSPVRWSPARAGTVR